MNQIKSCRRRSAYHRRQCDGKRRRRRRRPTRYLFTSNPLLATTGVFFFLSLYISINTTFVAEAVILPLSPARYPSQYRVLDNWRSIVGHLQNPALYSSDWADHCRLIQPTNEQGNYPNNNQTNKQQKTLHAYKDIGAVVDDHASFAQLVTNKPVTRGEIVSLIPVEGLRLFGGDNMESKRDETIYNNRAIGKGKTRLSAKGQQQQYSTPVDAYCFSTDITRPHEYHRASGITISMHVVVDPPSTQTTYSPSAVVGETGWLGHWARRHHDRRRRPPLSSSFSNTQIDQSLHGQPQGESNCRVVPLLGAMPLCALVATRDLAANQILIMADDHGNDNDEDEILPDNQPSNQVAIRRDAETQALALLVLKRYTAEISELRAYTGMAHPFPPLPPLPTEKTTRQRLAVGPSSTVRTFYNLEESTYPGLTCLHQDPRVWQIDNFLTPAECQAMIDLARPKLQPCLIKNADTGEVQPDPSRTSTNANLPQSAVPSVTAKICRLLTDPSLTNPVHPHRHLEIFQVLRYTRGQTFVPHTDGFDGPMTACGFEHSGRLVTFFCYLNTVQPGCGGETRFTKLRKATQQPAQSDGSHRDDDDDEDDNASLSIVPEQGKAVIHFPNSLDLQEDVRTEHESVPLQGDGEKWLLVTWYWKHARSDPAYHESLIE